MFNMNIRRSSGQGGFTIEEIYQKLFKYFGLGFIMHRFFGILRSNNTYLCTFGSGCGSIFTNFRLRGIFFLSFMVFYSIFLLSFIITIYIYFYCHCWIHKNSMYKPSSNFQKVVHWICLSTFTIHLTCSCANIMHKNNKKNHLKVHRDLPLD